MRNHSHQTLVSSLQFTGLSLRTNFVWTFIGNVFYAVSQWGIVVVLAKVGSASMVGQFALALALTAPIVMLANLQLRAVQATDAKDEYSFADYLALRLGTTLIAFFSLLVIVLFSGYSGQAALLILVVGLAKSIESVSDVIYGLIQKYEQMNLIATSMIVKGASSFTVMGVLVWATDSVLLGALGLAAAWLLVLFLYDVPQARRFSNVQPHINIPVMFRLFKLSLPLGIVMTLVSLNTNIPRYFIERILGEQELGYFAAVSYFMLAGNTIVGALGQSATPRLAKQFAVRESRTVHGLLFKLIGIGIVLGFIGWLVAVFFGSSLLAVLYTVDYASRADLFSFLMLVAGINYVASFLGYSMTAMRYFKIQIPLFTFVTVASIVCCAILVPSNGLTGAAQAMGIAALVQLLGSGIINVHALRSMRLSPKPAIT